jgi:hypothetical protein
MRRRLVKYSARPQLAPATSAPASATELSPPIQASAVSSSTSAIDTKMSLNPVRRRKLSSSTIVVALLVATWLRNASATAGVSTPAATAASRSVSLYMRLLLPCGEECNTAVLIQQYTIAVLPDESRVRYFPCNFERIAIDCSAPDCGTISSVRSIILCHSARDAFGRPVVLRDERRRVSASHRPLAHTPAPAPRIDVARRILDDEIQCRGRDIFGRERIARSLRGRYRRSCG